MGSHTVPAGPDPSATHTGADLVGRRSAEIMEAHWRGRGYTVPNAAVYPHQWLWDSCFHAVIWAHLGRPERAVAELRSALAHQHDDGFVPHMTYWEHPDMHAAFWGRPTTSTITQPPMYGHAIAELARRGVEVDSSLVRQAVAGLAFLVGPRRGDRELVPIVHPWESGCDDSPRWDRWAGSERSAQRWYERKGELVESLDLSPSGSALANPSFEVEAAGFNALVAFNAMELAAVGFHDQLPFAVEPLIDALDRRWDPLLATWLDDRDATPAPRTLEALLPVLVTGSIERVAAVMTELRDPDAFGGRCGPAQVHRGEPSFEPRAYWRGPAWPQLTYLFWVAAARHGRRDDAAWLARALRSGAERSGWAEYWDPDDGTGLGAVPQSWSALAAAVAPS